MARDEAGTGDFPSTSPDTCEVRNIADQAEIVVAQQTVAVIWLMGPLHMPYFDRAL